MKNITDTFRSYQDETPDVNEVLSTFQELENVYREALEAIGMHQREKSEVRNSAEVTISVPQTRFVYGKQ